MRKIVVAGVAFFFVSCSMLCNLFCYVIYYITWNMTLPDWSLPMPAFATITSELVVETAEELAAAGSKVTTETVRAALLSKTRVGGSHGTIALVLAKWKRERANAEVKVADVQTPIPQSLVVIRERNQREEWAVAVKGADARFEVEREQYRNEIARLADELREALALADSLQSKLDIVEADCHANAARAGEAEHQAIAMGERAQVAEACNQELMHRIEDASREAAVDRGRAVRLQEELSSVRDELRQSTAASMVAKEEAAELRGQVRGLQSKGVNDE